MSPFGARGANSGVQDAENLAWKLKLVLAGLAPDALLDTYDTPGSANAVVVVGARAYVADGGSGLEIFDVSDPANLTLLGRYDTAAAGRTGGGFGAAAGDEPPQPQRANVASTTHHVQQRLGDGWNMRTGSGLPPRLPVGSSIPLDER